MRLPDSYFENTATVLDVGGWFKPDLRATHVVDLMPWETRGARLSLEKRPQESFSKETWTQADFLSADFSLPFGDKSFDLVICGHTIEDLAAPERLLNEISRVGKAGVIECPSRITEQTMGIRDRMATRPGHPHHHWIVESLSGDLVLYSKQDSGLCTGARVIPLTVTEAYLADNPGEDVVIHRWQNQISFRMITGVECVRRAEAFVSSMKISRLDRAKDRLLRSARRTRDGLRGKFKEDYSWWDRILEESRPFSRIKLK